MMRVETIQPLMRHIVVLVLCLMALGQASTIPSSSPEIPNPNIIKHSIDLSGKHGIQSHRLAESIKGIVDKINTGNVGQDDDRERRVVVEVDVSHSSLQDDGFAEIVDALLPPSSIEYDKAADADAYDNKPPPPISVHLIARMNRISPVGVTKLFQSILDGDQSVTVNATSLSDQQGEETTGNRTQMGQEEEESETKPASDDTCITPRRRLESLDLCWNSLHPEARGAKGFQKTIQKLITNPQCPTTLRFDRCGMSGPSVRALAKGLIHRHVPDDDEHRGKESKETASAQSPSSKDNIQPLSLHLCGNSAVGDAGAAAIAAALRTIATDDRANKSNDNINEDEEVSILHTLDLSACNIGDAGAEALALAFETESPWCCCIQWLDLSNNKITDVGARSLARALASAGAGSCAKGLRGIDLSNNNIGDLGGSDIAQSMTGLVRKLPVTGTGIPKLTLRSCGIHADGAASFGKLLRSFAEEGSGDLWLDLSGNPIGILRGKKKEKISASQLKSKASATAASYFNKGVGFLRKGMKDIGVDASPILGSSAESDDEVEQASGGAMGEPMDEGPDPSKGRCGAKALANAFLEDRFDSAKGNESIRKIQLGLRHCYFDHGASDALAAMLVGGKDDLDVEIDMDVSLNPVLEEEMVQALHGDADYDEMLREMAERHQDVMEALRIAQERAASAAAAVAARIRAEEMYEDSWEAPSGMGGDYGFADEEDDEEDSGWNHEDSDADYDNYEDDQY